MYNTQYIHISVGYPMNIVCNGYVQSGLGYLPSWMFGGKVHTVNSTVAAYAEDAEKDRLAGRG